MKTDFFHKALKWIDHNRYLFAALVLICAMVIYVAGCTSMTASVLPPDGSGKPVKIDAVKLEQEVSAIKAQQAAEKAELDADAVKLANDQAVLLKNYESLTAAYNARVIARNARVTEKAEQVEIARADLAQQDARKAQIVAAVGQMVIGAASGGLDPVNTAAGVVAIGSLLFGGGTLLDNRRKNLRIETLSEQLAAAATPTSSPPSNPFTVFGPSIPSIPPPESAG